MGGTAHSSLPARFKVTVVTVVTGSQARTAFRNEASRRSGSDMVKTGACACGCERRGSTAERLGSCGRADGG